MHDARYLISHYAKQYVSVSQVGNSTQGQHSEKEPSMANVLTTGAWLSAPTRNPSFFARLLRSQIEARQRHADRLVEQYLKRHSEVMHHISCGAEPAAEVDTRFQFAGLSRITR